MNFVLDENLPPAFGRALNELSKSKHGVYALMDCFPKGTPDIEWITELGSSNSVVITQDAVHRDKLQRAALMRAGLRVFVLDKAWSKQIYWAKAANIVKWWPRIIEQADLVSGGAVFTVPWAMRDGGRFIQESL